MRVLRTSIAMLCANPGGGEERPVRALGRAGGLLESGEDEQFLVPAQVPAKTDQLGHLTVRGGLGA
ncbi:hypothetical protein [Nocardia nepalensis]|uniref:hypothetical protein n=1 Tax=Nocardia nepalensis TaxID=3375448 RepID=UPI003B67108E